LDCMILGFFFKKIPQLVACQRDTPQICGVSLANTPQSQKY